LDQQDQEACRLHQEAERRLEALRQEEAFHQDHQEADQAFHLAQHPGVVASVEEALRRFLEALLPAVALLLALEAC
jgi:hypothetical protein